ncbi:MAG: tyrosine-type recombinase/integrase [Lachnospiraceae bacterium]|nr:tyrosine-type recombinase/integrase [Lachnospiraceae bacterium]
MAKSKYAYNEKRGAWIASVWDGTYDEQGRKHRRQVSSRKSSRDLENQIDAIKQRVKKHGALEFSDLSFYDYALKWLATAKASRERNTRFMYENAIRVHLAFLGNVRISDIRHSHFQQAINKQLDHPRTCEIIALTFRQIVKSAVRDHLLPRSALDDILADVSLPAKQKKEKRPLSELEKEAIRKVDLDPRKRSFLLILYYCGLRREEALALSADDFDWKEKIVRIRRVIIFDGNNPELKNYPKTENGLRDVPLPDALIEEIRDYVDSTTGFLFRGCNAEMMTLSAYVRMWDSIVLALNVAAGYNPFTRKNRMEKPIQGLTAHIFRHNYCTELCYQIPAISTKMIARILGDTEKMVLDVYSHIVEQKENVQDAVNKINMIAK